MKVTQQPRLFGKGKSLFASLTFWSIICLLIQAASPRLEDMAKKKHVDPVDVFALVNVMALCIGGIIGRIEANEPIYTPKGIYGPNREDFELRRRTDDATDSAANILPMQEVLPEEEEKK